MSACAIIILNWNGAEDTIACLTSVQPLAGPDDYVFVVDNASGDDSVSRIEDHFGRSGSGHVTCKAEELSSSFSSGCHYYLIRNSENRGFGGGNNTVLKLLPELAVPFWCSWLLNNDAVAEGRSLSGLKECMRQDKMVAVAGSLILNYPDNGRIQCRGVSYFPSLGVSKLIDKQVPLNEADLSVVPAFDYLNGASFMVRMEALKACGYFDETFFLYSEELDLQLRMKEHGWKLALAQESRVYHRLSAGTSGNRHRFFYHYNSSAVLLTRKHYGFLRLVSVLGVLPVISFVRSMPSLKNFGWAVKGILNGLKGEA